MLVKTFKADDMPAALRMVKTEFGTNAMILSSRKEKRRGILGCFSKPYYEVTATLDNPPSALPSPQLERRLERRSDDSSTLDEFQKSMLAPLARELKELRSRVEKMAAPVESSKKPVVPPQQRMEVPVQRALDDAGGEQSMNGHRADFALFEQPFDAFQLTERDLPSRTAPPTELDELKKVLLRSMAAKDQSRPQVRTVSHEQSRITSQHEMVEQLAAELRGGGVGAEETKTIMVPVAAAAARGESERTLRELMKKTITSSVKCSLSLKPKKGETRIMAMVGPTGVGKTTTIAKLAASAYQRGISIALITIDTFRIGAVAQLQTYSGIMGLPLEVASTPQQLAEIIASHSDKQLIFIDTAGRTPRDQDKLQDMKAFLDVNPAIEVHLCLAATTRDSELAKTVTRFSVLPVNRLLFTKLDESESFGSIINVHLRDKFPLSYFTTGQKVPEDIEAATPAKVANLIVREIKP